MVRYCFILFVFSNLFVFSQQIITKGLPLIDHFDKAKDRPFSHIWDIDEAPNHLMYFVNEYGLVEFDGKYWQFFSGSKGITRSIKVVSNDLIYTGSDQDFGVWKKNSKNEFEYTSLYLKTAKPSNQVEEFWNVFEINGTVVFQSFESLYCYQSGQFLKIQAPSRFVSGNQSGDLIYLVDETKGVYTFDGNRLQSMSLEIDIPFSEIISVENQGNSLLFFTKRNGVYEKKGNALTSLSVSSHIKDVDVFSYHKISDTYFALGTIEKGVFIFDFKWNLVHKINKTKGLQNNTVLSMCYSSYGKLWLGLDFGIDVLHFNTPYSYFVDYEGKIGTTYASLLDDQKLFIGTNQGLYSIQFSELSNTYEQLDFQLIENSQGQVWSIFKLDNTVLCGHNTGLYKVDGENLKKIDSKPGVWSMTRMNNHLITGNYNGIHVYSIDKGISFRKSLAGAIGSFNALASYKNILFALIPKEGIVAFQLDSDFKVIKKELYSVDLFGNESIQFTIEGNRLIVSTIDRVFEKNLDKNSTFKSRPNEESLVLKRKLIKDFFIPIKLSNEYNLFSIYNGFALKNKNIRYQLPYKKLPSPEIRSVNYFNSEFKMFTYETHSIPFEFNNIRVQFLLPNSSQDIYYQYFLEGHSKKWTDWSLKSEVEFLDLKEGRYTLLIRAKSNGRNSSLSSHSFSIKAPFYRTWYAYTFYLVFAIFVVFMIRRHTKLKLKKQKLDLLRNQKEVLNEQNRKYKEELMIEKQQKLEIEQLQLKKTIENKELELAKKIIDQKEVNDLIQSIKHKIEEIQHQSSQKLEVKYYNDLIHFVEKKINRSVNKEYEIAFDNSQAHFHSNLLKAHPNLSSKDLRICSYLMMNLTSKEIAKILQVLPSSIDVNRSRLRKKLDLDEAENLRDYLSNFYDLRSES